MNSPQTLEPATSTRDDLLSLSNRLLENVGLVVLGKADVIKLAVVALLAEGHVLIEDVPGVGKTLLARPWPPVSTARSGESSSRPTCSPRTSSARASSTHPSGEFVFKPGPLFAHVILADEINRTTPRTQSALLEAMGDRQVSVEGKTYPLDPPFIVLATQNPFEFEGTYVLPESQLDRFMIRLKMGYPTRSRGAQVLSSHRQGEPVETLQPGADRRRRAPPPARGCGRSGSTRRSPITCSTSCT